MYELYIEGYRVDIDQKISVQLSFAIDDVANFSSRETAFSKTIVLPGTAYNNKIFGFIYNLGSANPTIAGGANIGSVFNVAQTSRAELRLNGLLVLKGVFRMLNIVNDNGMIEYEGSIFGELAGFITKIGNGKLEELDFSDYNHTYTRNNIVDSWNGFGSFTAYKISFSNYTTPFPPYVTVNKFSITTPRSLPSNPVFLTGSGVRVTGSNLNDGNYTITDYSILDIPGAPNIVETYTVSQTVQNESDTTNVDLFGTTGDLSGSGYYYPLIDYGTYSTDKVSYDYRTFRPALFVKEYIDKMFSAGGYTYESEFINSTFFKKLIIPNNTKDLRRLSSRQLTANRGAGFIQYSQGLNYLSFIDAIGGNFLITNSISKFKYNVALTIETIIKLTIRAQYTIIGDATSFEIKLNKNDIPIEIWQYNNTDNVINITTSRSVTLSQNDEIRVEILFNRILVSDRLNIAYTEATLLIDTVVPQLVFITLNDTITLNELIPRNILQRDFFTWILKMFNLYVTEDKLKDRHLIIEPYIDYYDNDNVIDWTYKIARDKPWQIKPMGMLNGRFFEYKYKSDNDFYNEGYNKKFNQPYGTMLYDTEFEFAKTKQTLEIGFSPTILVKYDNTDKVVSAIYKKSQGNDVDQEERTDSNIRILMAKRIEEVDSWYITEKDSEGEINNLGASLTAYGYAGHFDDPVNPTKDINFGAAAEIYFEPNTYPSNNLFNDYWSEYIGEIANKDSKLMSCHVYLKALDIAQLDFSKPVMIDGVQFRINKVEDYDYVNNDLVKVELLKVINNG